MFRGLLISIVSGYILSGCTNSGNQSTTEPEEADSTFMAPIEGPTETREFKTKSGKTWLVTQNQIESSLANVTVESQGFSEENRTVYFSEIDPVIQILQADLDKNGFEELYFITQSVGSGSYGTIYGLNSNNDKSVSEIYFEGASLYNTKTGDLYEGHMGHDDFNLVGGDLINTFPVYREGDSNANPTGGKRKVFYALMQGEATWQLKPTRAEEVK